MVAAVVDRILGAAAVGADRIPEEAVVAAHIPEAAVAAVDRIAEEAVVAAHILEAAVAAVDRILADHNPGVVAAAVVHTEAVMEQLVQGRLEA